MVDAQDGDARNTAISQVSGWALTEADVTAHRDDARALVGQRLAAVRYVNIDYVGMTRPEFEGRGPRFIEDDQEWQQPSPTCWRVGAGSPPRCGLSSGRVRLKMILPPAPS